MSHEDPQTAGHSGHSGAPQTHDTEPVGQPTPEQWAEPVADAAQPVQPPQSPPADQAVGPYWAQSPVPGFEPAPQFHPPAPPPGGTGPGLGRARGRSDGAGRGLIAGIIAGVIAGLVFGILGGVGGYLIASRTGGARAVLPKSEPANPEQLSPRADNSIAAIAKTMLPTTATIIVRGQGQGQGGSGSGFVIRSDGYLLTNNHVVAAGGAGGVVQVQFHNEEPVPAKVTGRSVPYDLAVVKVERGDLKAVQMGDSSTVAVGDAAIAVGSPLGLEGTVTSGIISALNRPVTTGGEGEASYISALQTDAPINPGNSGGPLVNAEAQVIGVTSAMATLGPASSGQSGSIGLGFAIPVNTAKRIAEEIISTGKASYPILGVNVDTRYEGDGAKINSVEPGSPAARAGLQDGDVILSVNGILMTGYTDLLSSIRSFAPGDTVTLKVKGAKGGTREVKVTLASKSD